MIAITGANGNLGSATIQNLLQKTEASDIVAIVRNPETVVDFREQGVIILKADYNDYNSLSKAFENVKTALQVSTVGVDTPAAQFQEGNVVKAMETNQVSHIVYTSMVQARPNTIFQGTAAQFHTEELIRKTGIPYTFFRNNMYMEAIPGLIGYALETGEIRYPSGNGKVGYASRQDIAEAIAKVLTAGNNMHENKTYEITGSEAWSFRDLAQIISEEKGLTIKHLDISDETFRMELNSYQLPIQVVDLLVSMANAIKAGEFSHTENTLGKLLGRKPMDLTAYIKSL
ncbi:SDR family oxidoreductase [Belliella marina]|uniref:SDR family oxidoreductase n=1 Tax=Belliella marina TaxID=1644146 RepID=A0ABW4VHB5_9BACT